MVFDKTLMLSLIQILLVVILIMAHDYCALLAEAENRSSRALIGRNVLTDIWDVVRKRRDFYKEFYLYFTLFSIPIFPRACQYTYKTRFISTHGTGFSRRTATSYVSLIHRPTRCIIFPRASSFFTAEV